jgi:HJR/Mrr/RecB family endonuclease
MNLERLTQPSANLITLPDPPQPIDYGLTRDETFHGFWLSEERRLSDEMPEGGFRSLKFKQGDWVGFWSGWALAVFFPLYLLAFAAFVALNPIPGGWSWSNPRAIAVFFLGMIFPGFILFGISCAIAQGVREGRKRKYPSAALLAYRQALRQYKLDLAAARAAARKAQEAEQSLLRQKRSYWECLNGYEFERQTAEVLKQHQFNPIVTRGSADGGVDIEVTRHGQKGVVQCKAHVACVGPHTVRDLYGVIHHSNSGFGIIVSRGGFTKGAVEFAANKPIFFNRHFRSDSNARRPRCSQRTMLGTFGSVPLTSVIGSCEDEPWMNVDDSFQICGRALCQSALCS